jgi:hypothetical protein
MHAKIGRILPLLMGVMCAAASATAAPIAYDIHFTSVFSIPVTGSFVYDAVARSFSSFIVNFDGDVANFTSAANNPTIEAACSTQVVKTTPTDIEDYFRYLSGNAPNGCGDRTWIAFGLSGTLPPQFRFRLGNLDAFAFRDLPAGAGQMAGLVDSGNFTISAVSQPSSVPEASSLVLILAGGALVSWCRSRRR